MKNAYRIYLLLCIGIGIFFQHSKPHPDYLIGGFLGLAGSWIGPGIVLEFFTGHSKNMVEILGGSFVFWLIAGLIYKSGRKKSPRGRGRGIAVDTDRYNVLPDLPPGFSYYNKNKQTTRTTYYTDEEG